MTYETVARFAQQFGLVYFGLIFLAGSVWALLPRHRDTYRAAARLPLEEEDL
ncbi:CcoQ/FixQ family Cbb3-type cytochrome c oxidase assembly chaperone [Caulobacter sp. SLTY]|uniref:CcoQ/FixQ family Cbb3-type cytochrome c oxidase assembly chaperone n=1 Tax=Caulobacter sp. SLTY TaxID=2683262 RepID=UPI0014129865|nr:CcoQ/FixQ family Cbb3-type cytochrome c oxidase assembly chaperone [Caulobacter sp. SLTY]